LSDFNFGFGAVFLDAGYWRSDAALSWALIGVGIAHILISAIGLYKIARKICADPASLVVTDGLGTGTTKDDNTIASRLQHLCRHTRQTSHLIALRRFSDSYLRTVFVLCCAFVCVRLDLPLFSFFWQFWLGLLLACVPDTWLSGITTTWIFLHNISEFTFFALRWVLLDGVDKAANGGTACSACGECCQRQDGCCRCCSSCCTLSRMVICTVVYFTIAAILMMLTGTMEAASLSRCALHCAVH
jgi:hypothetical protein